jgi:uncharacterized RDD family membrane protein YckC
MKNKKHTEKPVISTETVSQAATTATSSFKNLKSENNEAAMPFAKANYTVMLIGLAVIVVGFFIMTLDKEPFGFGFLGITLGPIVALTGFMIEFYAILKK